MPWGEPFESLEEAAYRGLAAAREASGDDGKEWAGIVFEHEGQFFHSTPQTSGGSHTFNIRAGAPRGARVAGIYHTHPGGPDERAHVFSAPDIQTARQLGLPSFISHGAGEVLAFRPGETPVKQDRRVGRFRSDSMYSEGEPIRFPKMSVGESTVNRILNLADEINEEATTP